MNKKGFTLIELLVVMTIIIAITASSVISYTRMTKNMKEREYNNICEKLKGVQIKLGPTSNTYINILEIRKESIEDSNNGYLATKIRKTNRIFPSSFWRIKRRRKSTIRRKIDRDL